jgi:hypothetical protein
MVGDRIRSVRQMTSSRSGSKVPRRLPRQTTKHKHERLLSALDGDRRLKRLFG